MSGSSLAPGHTKRSRTSDAEKDRTKRRRFSKGALDVTEDVQLAAKGQAIENNTQYATSTQDTSAHARDQQTKFSRQNWCLSSPVGGQYSNLDPIITSNEEVFKQGQAIVAWAGQRLLLGAREFNTPDPSTMQYAWREVVLPVRVTCVDVRESGARNRTTPQGSQDNNLDTMDLVLGESGGSILIYPDFLALFPTGGIGSDDSKGLAPRRLHWHRGPVNAVRWSKDGGDESVMVLWQLDTGRKQFLPHLSSPICNLVVSTTGKAYIVKLADNCIMVLSATELQPYVTITGLQLCHQVNKPADAAMPESRVALQPPAAVLHPQFHDRLLVAVPASRQSARNHHSTTSSCMLQTYDIRTNSQISRQALARTNATTLRISPEGTEIVTPNVSHLGICQDGKWMATIDDWIPRPEDIRALDSTSASSGSHTLHRETYLKFWRWDEVSNTWKLTTHHTVMSLQQWAVMPCSASGARVTGHAWDRQRNVQKTDIRPGNVEVLST
ncbi:hypothetical protein KXV92_002116 [Aspergillus fumigatus]|nr:hypothetical protein KXX57_009586 [Aspergillus fumigatus]KAH1975865.1 hypothetical protein KXW88_009450 [Aspergillus fumigatus]KAH2752286.1 hypothetical protein KXV94_002163 [Aspergillus fumigatus]KAH2912419.1 hypothetical protein KXW25_001837 [Aspergillus fumigatus]KAH3141415.1 hypothetical protein KXW18_002079 [Aspergillus fumigatus]